MESDPASPEVPRTTEWNLRGVLEVLFRHQTKGLLAFLVIVGAVGAWAILAPHVYRSEAKLLVQVGRESVTLDPTAAIGERTLDPRTTWENEVNSELEVLKNAGLRQAVVREVGAPVLLGRGSGGAGLARGPGPLERFKSLVRRFLPASGPQLSEEDRAEILLESQLDIRSVPDSSVLKVAYEARTPELAQRVVSAFTELFLEKHREVHRTQGSLEFFTAEVARLEASLGEAEDHLRDLKTAAAVGTVEEKRASLTSRVGTLQQEALLAQAGAAASAAKVQALESALAGLGDSVLIQETTSLRSPSTDALQEQLDLLRLEERSLLESFEEGSRAVQAVREKIALATEMLTRTPPAVTERVEGANPARSQILVALLTERALEASLQAQAAAFEHELAALQGELGVLNGVELEVKRANRRIEDLEARYLRQRANLEQVRTDRALEDLRISNIAVLQPATRPLKSSRLGRTPALLVGLVLGLMGAIATAYLAEFMDQSLRTPDGVRQRLGLPAMVSIPRRAALRRWRGVAVVPTDEISLLRDKILGRGTGKAMILGVTAAGRGEGVSTVAANLATDLARRGEGQVLLVDAALDAPVLHRAFQAARTPGLTEVLLAGAAASEYPSEVPRLSVLTAGDVRKRVTKGTDRRTVTEHAFDRLALDLERLSGEWLLEYEYVVLDLSAIGRVSSVPRIAAGCDGVLLVVAADGPRWQVVQNALERLAHFEAKVLGVVLNKRRYPIPGWLYRHI